MLSSAHTSFPAVWAMLEKHYADIRSIPLKDFFAADPDRFSKFSIEMGPLLLDYSKTHISEKTLSLLFSLATAAHLRTSIDALFSGEKTNTSEQRPALHTALRRPLHLPITLDHHNLMPLIKCELEKMRKFTDTVRQGKYLGYTEQAITDIVTLGIGGSHIGPHMAVEALAPYHTPTLRCHFVSTLDGGPFSALLHTLNPATTLFILSSKSFNSSETLTNARAAQHWIQNAFGTSAAFHSHFVAVTAHPEKAQAFGLSSDHIFELWEWVGGRYSLWSTIGLPLVLAIGMDHFLELLAGAHAMDEHFQSASFEANMPVIFALLGIWYNNFFKAPTHAIIPYDDRLHALPAYLQQLVMESNGKRVHHTGHPTTTPTAPITWGALGCNAQHTFFQLLHQGTQLIPTDFIAVIKPHHTWHTHHTALFAHCLSQSQALLQGKNEEEVMKTLLAQGLSQTAAKHLAPHQVIPGNQPSHTLLLQQLTPFALGSLLALYEHKVYVQSVIWQINPFDQWGVELGKQLSLPLMHDVQQRTITQTYDASTRGLLAHYCKHSASTDVHEAESSSFIT